MFKLDCQKYTTHNIRHEKRSKIKPIKLGKKLGQRIDQGVKITYTNNFKSQEIKMTNKGLREKLNYVVCQPSKSRFLKQKHNNKK